MIVINILNNICFIKLIIKLNSISFQRTLKIASVTPKLLKVTLFNKLSKLSIGKVMKSK